jgi:hypothetical protein
VLAGLQVHVLEDAVEVVDDADVVAIREDLGVARRFGDPHAAVGPAGQRVVEVARRVAVVVDAARPVVDADAEARPVVVRPPGHDRHDPVAAVAVAIAVDAPVATIDIAAAVAVVA